MKTELTSEDLYPYASTKNVAVRICRDKKWFIGKLNYIDLNNEALMIRLFALQEIDPPDNADDATKIVPEYKDEWKQEFWHNSPPFRIFNNPLKDIENSKFPIIRIECEDSVVMLSTKEDDIIAVEKLLENKPR